MVVVGVEGEDGAVIMNDPARARGRRIAHGTFDKRWAEADHWTLLVMRGKP